MNTYTVSLNGKVFARVKAKSEDFAVSEANKHFQSLLHGPYPEISEFQVRLSTQEEIQERFGWFYLSLEMDLKSDFKEFKRVAHFGSMTNVDVFQFRPSKWDKKPPECFAVYKNEEVILYCYRQDFAERVANLMNWNWKIIGLEPKVIFNSSIHRYKTNWTVAYSTLKSDDPLFAKIVDSLNEEKK